MYIYLGVVHYSDLIKVGALRNYKYSAYILLNELKKFATPEALSTQCQPRRKFNTPFSYNSVRTF